MRPPTKSTSATAKPFSLDRLLDLLVEGTRPVDADALATMLSLQNDGDLEAIRQSADRVRQQQVGEPVATESGCSLYLTNLCELAPRLYPYPKTPGDKGAYTLTLDDIDAVLELAGSRGLKRLYVSGGGFWPFLMIPGLEKPTLLKTYARLLTYIREKNPALRLEGFSPDEIDFLCVVSDRTERYVLEFLKDQGVVALGGHGVGVLADSVRRKISPKLATVKHWFEIVAIARQAGIPVTLKMEMGHHETLAQRVQHLLRVRAFLQKNPNAFSSIVPELFAKNPNAQPEWTGLQQAGSADRLKLQALIRLLLGDVCPAQQVFWQPDEINEAQECLQWGANDLGATDALARHAFVMGRSPKAILAPDFTEAELQKLIQETGRTR